MEARAEESISSLVRVATSRRETFEMLRFSVKPVFRVGIPPTLKRLPSVGDLFPISLVVEPRTCVSGVALVAAFGA